MARSAHCFASAVRPAPTPGADGEVIESRNHIGIALHSAKFLSTSSNQETPMPTLDRNGVTIHYEVHGNGPAVLLSHGYSATCRMWDGQIAAFMARYKVIVWDLRGHGLSAYPKEAAAYSEALTVADMAAILDACGEKRAVIGGLSLGGYMSLAFHVRHA